MNYKLLTKFQRETETERDRDRDRERQTQAETERGFDNYIPKCM